jgi:hypothetical protein
VDQGLREIERKAMPSWVKFELDDEIIIEPTSSK